MDTSPTSGEQHLAPIDHITTSEAGEGRRWSLATWWRDTATVFVRDNWLLGVFALAALATLSVLLWTIWVIVTKLVNVADAGVDAAGAWITDGPITHSISDPLRAYLDTHSGGLPATGRDLWVMWLVAAGALYLGALFGSTYARIGWAAIGALTGVAVYAGAPASTGPAAAGLTTLVWLTLSLLAYAGRSNLTVGNILPSLAHRRDRDPVIDSTY
ncbi:hypothetical protein [Micromonospora sp. CA-246542]|uniref:hypothetical protein n=1 Tax=Micromonospora sp. CA-246542 TaxID=3239959 RepID=UPI003D921E02